VYEKPAPAPVQAVPLMTHGKLSEQAVRGDTMQSMLLPKHTLPVLDVPNVGGGADGGGDKSCASMVQ
jgi:hypothetical protein